MSLPSPAPRSPPRTSHSLSHLQRQQWRVESLPPPSHEDAVGVRPSRSQAVLSNLTALSPCKDSRRLWDQGVGGHSPSGRREGSM